TGVAEGWAARFPAVSGAPDKAGADGIGLQWGGDIARRSNRPTMWKAMIIAAPVLAPPFQPDRPIEDRYVGPAHAIITSSTTAQTIAVAKLRTLNISALTFTYAQAAAMAMRNPGAKRIRSTIAAWCFRTRPTSGSA